MMPSIGSGTIQFLSRLHIEFPLIQAPMAGGPTTPALVAAVANNGCLANVAGGYLSPEQLEQQILEVKKLTSHPFAVNVFIPESPAINDHQVKLMQEKLNHYRKILNIPTVDFFQFPENDFDQQMEVILSHRIPVFSFTFGLLDPRYISVLKANKTYLMGTATNLEEAKQLEALGCDAIIAQGYEAGGHRGTFYGDYKHSFMGITPFTQQLVSQLRVPVIAAGGIMNGRGLLAMLHLGAVAVQMGSAFLICPESGASEVYKEVLVKSEGEDTELTRAFSGKYARGLNNSFMDDFRDDENILAYPLQNYLTSDIRKASALQRSDFLSLWAGQGIGLLKDKTLSANDIIEKIKLESAL